MLGLFMSNIVKFHCMVYKKKVLTDYAQFIKVLLYLWTAYAFIVISGLNVLLVALNYLALNGNAQNYLVIHLVIHYLVKHFYKMVRSVFFRVPQKCPWKKCEIYIFCHKRRIIFFVHVKFSKENCLTVWNRIHKFSRAF